MSARPTVVPFRAVKRNGHRAKAAPDSIEMRRFSDAWQAALAGVQKLRQELPDNHRKDGLLALELAARAIETACIIVQVDDVHARQFAQRAANARRVLDARSSKPERARAVDKWIKFALSCSRVFHENVEVTPDEFVARACQDELPGVTAARIRPVLDAYKNRGGRGNKGGKRAALTKLLSEYGIASENADSAMRQLRRRAGSGRRGNGRT